MNVSYQLQRATRADYSDLSDVMFEAVRSGPSKYTEQQRAEWVPHRSGEQWNARLDRQMIVLVRNTTGIAGFMSLAPNGCTDFAYIRPAAQGTGLSVNCTRLLNDIASSGAMKAVGTRQPDGTTCIRGDGLHRRRASDRPN